MPGMFLTDLMFIDTGNKDLTDDGLINFGKRRLVAETIAQIQQYQQQPYLVHRVEAIAVRAPSPGVGAARRRPS